MLGNQEYGGVGSRSGSKVEGAQRQAPGLVELRPRGVPKWLTCVGFKRATGSGDRKRVYVQGSTR